MKTTKKIIAIVLSVMLLLSVMPFAAFAATTDVTDDLATAVANAAAGDTLSLTQDVEVTSITIDKALTIDLNGHTITTSAPSYSAAVFVITSTGDLTIKSTGASTLKTSDAEGTVTYTAGKVQTSKRVVMNSGIFTLASGILEGDDIVAVKSNSTTTIKGGWCKGYDGAIFAGQNVTGATINVKGGAITSEDNACVMTNGTSNCYGNTVNISSGKMYARMSQASVQKGYMAMAIYHPSNNTLNISGGTMKAFDGAGVVIRGGDVNISGGTIIATGDKTGKCGDANAPLVVSSAIVVDTQCNYPSSATVDVDITKGTFNSDIAVISTYDEGAATDADAAITITGGTFKANGVAADVSEYIDPATDKVVDANGKVLDALFEVNGTKYAHITEAVAAVPADGTQTTIKLLKDVSDSGYGGAKVQAGQNIIFDLDTHTWTLRGTVGSTGTLTNGFQFLNGSTVTIKDGTINASLASIYTVIQNYGDLTIDNATINANYSQVNRTAVSSNNGSVLIKDSTIYMKSTQDSSQAIGITPGLAANYKDTSVVIENSTITGDVYVNSQAADSTAELEFKGTTTLDGDIRVTEDATGEFTVKNTSTGVEAPDGYKWGEDGILTELQDTTVAVIGSTEYATLEAAIAAAQSGDTVKLVADVTATSVLTLNNAQNLKIHLNGKTITADGNGKTAANVPHIKVYPGTQLSIYGPGSIVTANTPNPYDGALIKVYGAADDSGAASQTNIYDGAVISSSGYGISLFPAAGTKAAYNATIAVSNGTVENTSTHDAAAIAVSGNIQSGDSTITIAKATITGNSTKGVGVFVGGNASVSFNSSSVATVSGATGIYQKGGKVTFGETASNVTVTGNGASADYKFYGNGFVATGDAYVVDNCGYPAGVPVSTINNGKFTSENGEAVASYTKQDDPLYPSAEFEVVDEIIPATSTAVFSSNVSALAAEGYATIYDEAKGGYVVEEVKNAANLALEGTIEENIYIDADAYNLGDDAVIKVNYNASTNISETPDPTEETYLVKDLTPYTDPKGTYTGTYKFSFKQAPAQITEDVTVALYADENAQEPVKSITYSVKDYCDNVIATSNNAKLVALCKSILDYGMAAQEEFEYNLNNPAETDGFYNADAIQALTYSDITGTRLEDGIGITGCAFQCLANTNINLYFDEPLTGAGIINAYVEDGNDQVPVSATYMRSTKTGRLFISVNGIAADDMTKDFTVVTSNNGSVTTNLNTIVKTCLYYGTAETLAKTIYFYAQAADAYFN